MIDQMKRTARVARTTVRAVSVRARDVFARPDAQPDVRSSGGHECETYQGYDGADLDRIAALRPDEPVDGRAGFATDFVGSVLAVDMVPGADRFDGQVVAQLPVPSDQIHAETAEYAALARSFDFADGERYSIVELGAGWSPWMVLAGITAKRRGYREIRLTGIEADEQHLEFAARNLADNGLRAHDDRSRVADADGVRCELIPAAIWWEDTTLHFPENDDAMDYGLAAQPDDSGTDYRGVEFAHREVPAVGLPNLLAEHGPVDLLHVDIQGSEVDVLSRSIDACNTHVRMMCIGTHSRKIEGQLLELLHDAGWHLHGEKPCRFVQNADRTTITGMTTSDGVQNWINPRLTS